MSAPVVIFLSSEIANLSLGNPIEINMNKTSGVDLKSFCNSAVLGPSIFVCMDPQAAFFLHICYTPFTNEMMYLLWNIWLLGQGTTLFFFQLYKGHTSSSVPIIGQKI